VQIFDFSERKVSNRASVLVDAAKMGGASGAQVLVTRVGDALQEPFWPEGLGINRGFLHVLDCADLAKQYANLEGQRQQRQAAEAEATTAGATAAAGVAAGDHGGELEYDASLQQIVARREALYNCTKRISSTTIKAELKPHTDAKRELRYRIDPSSRYTHLPLGTDWDGQQQQREAAKEQAKQAQRAEEEAAEAKFHADHAKWSADLAEAARLQAETEQRRKQLDGEGDAISEEMETAIAK
jgi:hypothetical protein